MRILDDGLCGIYQQFASRLSGIFLTIYFIYIHLAPSQSKPSTSQTSLLAYNFMVTRQLAPINFDPVVDEVVEDIQKRDECVVQVVESSARASDDETSFWC